MAGRLGSPNSHPVSRGSTTFEIFPARVPPFETDPGESSQFSRRIEQSTVSQLQIVSMIQRKDLADQNHLFRSELDRRRTSPDPESGQAVR